MKRVKQWIVIMLIFAAVLLIPEAEVDAVSLPHIHSGSSASGGGCYTVKKTGTKYETVTLQCKPTQGSTGLCAHTCPQCGYGGSYTYSWGWYHQCGKGITDQRSYYVCGSCGYTFDSRVSISCGASYQKSNPVSYTYYEAGCTQTTCGNVQITSSTSEPAQSVTLSCEATSEGSGCSITGYSWSNGGGSSSISVSENGTYTCTVSYQDSGSGGTGTAEVSVTVSNIDKTPPSIQSCGVSSSGLTNQSVEIVVSATDGSALSYSMDGSNWQSGGSFTVGQNGTYTIYVRDKAGNQTSSSVTVSNIDKQGPDVSIRLENSNWHSGNNKILITASDTNGLASEPYSYDGGASWTSSSTYEIGGSGEYRVQVKDAAGNITEKSIHAERVPLPTATPTPLPTSTPKPTATPLPTSTPMPTITATPTPGVTATAIPTATPVPTERVTNTSVPSSVPTPTMVIEIEEEELENVPPLIEATETPTPTNTPEPTATPELTAEPTPAEIVTIQDPQTPTAGIVTVIKYVTRPSLATPIEGGLFVWLGIYLFGTVRVYAKSSSGRFVMIGKVNKSRRKKKGKYYLVKLSKKHIKKAETGHFMLQFSPRFAKRHEAEALVIKPHRGNPIRTRIASEVTFYYEEE